MLRFLVEFVLRSLGTLLQLCGELAAGGVGHLNKTSYMLAQKDLVVERKSINGNVRKYKRYR